MNLAAEVGLWLIRWHDGTLYANPGVAVVSAFMLFFAIAANADRRK